MIIITSVPRTIAIAVPATPEFGRNFFPGLTNDPQPMIQPNAIDHTCIGFNCLFKFSYCFIFKFPGLHYDSLFFNSIITGYF